MAARAETIVVLCRHAGASDLSGLLAALYLGRFPAARISAMVWDRVEPLEQLLATPDAQLPRQGSAHQIVALPPDAVSGPAERMST